MGVGQVTAAARKKLFLADFAKHGTISEAARHAGIDRRSHYDWLENDPTYKQRFEDARAEFAEWLEAHIRKQATKARSPNPTLAIFLMKKWCPEFRDNYKVDLAGVADAPVNINVRLVKPLTQDGAGEN